MRLYYFTYRKGVLYCMGITERIYHELKRRLENGVYLSGSRFPSETSLADEFSVNKMTMNKVVSLLVTALE